MSGVRPAANRSTLLQFKARIVGAKKGHGLLKKKRDALKTKFQAMLREIVLCKKAVGNMVKDCALSYAKAEYSCDSDFSQSVLNRVKKPSITLDMKAENCAGVQLPSFQFRHDPNKDASTDSLGIGCGGSNIQLCRDQHRNALELFVKMASLQSMFVTLDQEIKMTSRRVNALECVVIPRLTDTMDWIKQEMDEMEREDFFRVKKIVDKKKQAHQKQLDELMKGQGANGNSKTLNINCLPNLTVIPSAITGGGGPESSQSGGQKVYF